MLKNRSFNILIGCLCCVVLVLHFLCTLTVLVAPVLAVRICCHLYSFFWSLFPGICVFSSLLLQGLMEHKQSNLYPTLEEPSETGSSEAPSTTNGEPSPVVHSNGQGERYFVSICKDWYWGIFSKCTRHTTQQAFQSYSPLILRYYPHKIVYLVKKEGFPPFLFSFTHLSDADVAVARPRPQLSASSPGGQGFRPSSSDDDESWGGVMWKASAMEFLRVNVDRRHYSCSLLVVYSAFMGSWLIVSL